VAYAYNPSSSGVRNREDHSLKPAQEIVCETLSQKYPTQNRDGNVSIGTAPTKQLQGHEFKPQYWQK
jgi:hypothetical protein